MPHKIEPLHHLKSSHKLDWSECAPLLSDEKVLGVSRYLAESKGGYPQQLAAATGISPREAVMGIQKLEKCGIVRKDEEEIKEFGEEWAFYSLTSEGYRVIKDLKHIGKFE